MKGGSKPEGKRKSIQVFKNLTSSLLPCPQPHTTHFHCLEETVEELVQRSNSRSGIRGDDIQQRVKQEVSEDIVLFALFNEQLSMLPRFEKICAQCEKSILNVHEIVSIKLELSSATDHLKPAQPAAVLPTAEAATGSLVDTARGPAQAGALRLRELCFHCVPPERSPVFHEKKLSPKERD